jgi:hypothetical protein
MRKDEKIDLKEGLILADHESDRHSNTPHLAWPHIDSPE